MQIISGILSTPLKVIIYGPEGIGKSTFAAQAPSPLFIDTEGSTSRMNIRRLPAPASFTMLQEEIRYVISNPTVCQTLVLDTADWAERLCRDSVCAKNSKSGLEDFGYGRGYTYVYEEFGRMLNLLDQITDCGIHVIVTAHAMMRKFEQPDESGAYDRWELKLINAQRCSIANMLKEWADMVLFANYETYVIKGKNEMEKNKVTGGKRVMYTTHHPCWDAKNRFGLADKLPFEFAQIAHCFSIGNAVSATTTQLRTTQEQTISSVEKGKENPTQMPASMDVLATSNSDSGISATLAQLMSQYQVTEEQIQKVVALRGYYPESTPIYHYDTHFVEGVLVGAWQQVYQTIKEKKL